MKYTNKLGLSNALAKAIIAFSEDYDKVGWKSITTLIDSPRAQLLRERHSEDITEDVSDLIWTFFGNMGHLIAERHAGQDVLAEQRFVHRILGKEISLKPDRLEKDVGSVPITWTLRDFKVTSVFILKSANQGHIKVEWERQLNCYAYILELLGFKISAMKLEVIARDWRFSEYRVSPHDYPATQAAVFNVPAWSNEERQKYVEDRIKLYAECELLADDDLPKCTMQERWADPDTWAVVSKDGEKSKISGRRKALPGGGSFNSDTEARTFIQNQRTPKAPISKNPKPETLQKSQDDANARADAMEVEFRPSESIRCERGYCKAAPFCNQFKLEIKPAF